MYYTGNCLIDLSPSCQKVVENDLDIFLTTLRSHFDDLLWNPVMKDVDDKSWTMQRHKELHAVTKVKYFLWFAHCLMITSHNAILCSFHYNFSNVLVQSSRKMMHCWKMICHQYWNIWSECFSMRYLKLNCHCNLLIWPPTWTFVLNLIFAF